MQQYLAPAKHQVGASSTRVGNLSAHKNYKKKDSKGPILVQILRNLNILSSSFTTCRLHQKAKIHKHLYLSCRIITFFPSKHLTFHSFHAGMVHQIFFNGLLIPWSSNNLVIDCLWNNSGHLENLKEQCPNLSSQRAMQKISGCNYPFFLLHMKYLLHKNTLHLCRILC